MNSLPARQPPRPAAGRESGVPPRLSPADPVRPLVVTTRGLAPRQQFEAWRDLSVPYLDTGRPQSPPDHGFEARGTALPFGAFMYYHAVLPPYDYSRSQTRIRRDSLDHWIIAHLPPRHAAPAQRRVRHHASSPASPTC